MTLVYSITNKDITIFDKNGRCLLITAEPIEAVIKRYDIKDADIRVTL